jgi:hypothetical protein
VASHSTYVVLLATPADVIWKDGWGTIDRPTALYLPPKAISEYMRNLESEHCCLLLDKYNPCRTSVALPAPVCPRRSHVLFHQLL